MYFITFSKYFIGFSYRYVTDVVIELDRDGRYYTLLTAQRKGTENRSGGEAASRGEDRRVLRRLGIAITAMVHTPSAR
jgi:hypothetical protein